MALTLNHLNDKFAKFARQLISKAAPLLQFDFHGHQPDALTALMDELADRPLQPPEYMDPSLISQIQGILIRINKLDV